jgi:hypothetical protein
MTERSDRVTSAVATTNGFAMSVRFSRTTACADRIPDNDPYQEFVRWWWQTLRVLINPIFLI